MKLKKKYRIIILMSIFIILFGLNVISDYIIRPENIDILRNFSVALGITIGIGIVVIFYEKK